MKIKLFLIIFLLFNKISAIEIDNQSSNMEILPQSYIYIDKTNRLSIDEIKSKNFIANQKKIISIGFSPNSALWIKFKLKNITNHPITKIIEYANPITEELTFFNNNKTIIEGAWHIPSTRTTINPIFTIRLNPNEERVFFLKAHSTISTVIAQIILWSPQDFNLKDERQKVLIVIFFTIMATLLLYNFFIYFFTKDRAYLYYILYLLAIIINESTYTGVAQLYILSNEWTIFVTKYIMILTAFLIIMIILFTREFLHTYRFKYLDMLLRVYLYLVPILSILSCNNFIFDANIIVLFLPLGGLIIFTGFYALWNGVKEARFYVIGWSMVLIALIITNLQTLGILEINELIKYINDFSFIAETFLFSIALAHRIKVTNEKILELQQKEQYRLEKLVSIKTKELQNSLAKEELLHKELNHRVKNNFQMILSLIKLQILNSSNDTTKKELTTIQNRINSIAHLYEILQIDTHKPQKTLEYFQAITNHIEQSFKADIKIIYHIGIELSTDRLIYCGLILNELVTNSFKYAFKEGGLIEISLYQKDKKVYFVIKDNGVGYNTLSTNNSLGLLIVQTLVDKQLLGTIQTNTDKGVENIISWEI